MDIAITRFSERFSSQQLALSQSTSSQAGSALSAGQQDSASAGLGAVYAAGSSAASALYAPPAATSNAMPSLDLGTVQVSGGLRDLANFVLRHMLMLSGGVSALSTAHPAAKSSAQQDAASVNDTTTEQDGLSAQQSTGSLALQGTITADNGSIYSFALSVQVGQESAAASQTTSTGGSSSLALYAASAMAMQAQISVSFAGNAQGLNSNQQGSGTDQTAGSIVNGLAAMAMQFAESVGTGPLASDSAAVPAAAQQSQNSTTPFSGTLSLAPSTASTTALTALFGQLSAVLNSNSGGASSIMNRRVDSAA